MMIQEAIDKANEGGYHIYGSDGMDTSYIGANDEYSAWTRTDNDSSFIGACGGNVSRSSLLAGIGTCARLE
jgi:hypothetical protein